MMVGDAAPVVLVIEDDPDTQEVYVDMLEAVGLRVVIAESGETARRRLEEGLRPDAIILDLMMADGDGLGFRRWQRERAELAGVPVIVASASGMSPDELAAVVPDRVLSKPFGFRELAAALASFFPVRAST
jgi:CheY-like chemotaxis protein